MKKKEVKIKTLHCLYIYIYIYETR
jgi:hypothetical protein